jgi:glutaredoxin
MPDQQPATDGDAMQAIVYRIVSPEHVCPFGVRALALLQGAGFEVDDRWLETRAQTDAFMAEQGVRTTPLIFVAGERVGGCDDLERWLGKQE